MSNKLTEKIVSDDAVMVNKEPAVDEEIMAELLQRPGIRERVAQMTADELTWYKKLLVDHGIYAGWVKERNGG